MKIFRIFYFRHQMWLKFDKGDSTKMYRVIVCFAKMGTLKAIFRDMSKFISVRTFLIYRPILIKFSTSVLHIMLSTFL